MISRRLTFITLAVLVAAVPAVLRAQNPPASSAPSAAAPAPAAHKWVVPLPPGELLKLLPATPDQWQLKHSTAKNFFMDWASSQAQREFSYTPPAIPDAAPPPTHVVRFTITDTGYYAGLMGDLQSTQAPRPGEAESLTLNGFPARKITVSKTQERLRLLVKSRYIIQLDVQNEPVGNAQKWLGLIDLTKFATLPVEGEETLPHPFPIVRIDELDPRNNSVSKASFATQEEADRTVKRH